MRIKCKIGQSVICIYLLWSIPAAAQSPGSATPGSEPVIELPADHTVQPSIQPAVQPLSGGLPRETQIENALGRVAPIQGSAFGGYGEMTLNKVEGQPGVVDLRRVVLYFGHNFTERLRFYSELEIEHAIASADDHGEAEVEQAYLDGLLSQRFNLRGGLIVMPVGIVNIYHEPPTFNGVDRPLVDSLVVPSTWREAGFGAFGVLTEGLRYQLYVVNGFNANGFSAESSIRGGHQEAQLARAGDFGAVARLDFEPWLGTNFGVSGYHATSGNSLSDTVGRVPVSLFEVDARTSVRGFTGRAQFAATFIGDAAALNTALVAAMNMEGPVSAQARGGYAEAGYDLLRLLTPEATETLTLFGRYDYVDTQASVPAGFIARPEFRRHSLTAGLTFRPIPQIALKLDYRRHFFGAGESRNEVASAITWMF